MTREAVELVQSALAQDVELRISANIEADRPYTELFTEQRAFVNGPLVHFYRNNTPMSDNQAVVFLPSALDISVLPDLDFTAINTWKSVDLGAQHAGLMSLPVFLLKYNTNRARANRFYTNFLCQPFQAPDGGLPEIDNATPSLDLAKREGCKYCHAILGPAAAHWGRFGQNGSLFLDPKVFPAKNETCVACAATPSKCPAICKTHYVIAPQAPEEEPYVGWLWAYEFLAPEHHTHVEEGPSLLFQWY